MRPPNVSVISFVLPVTYKTRLSMRRESIVPSLRWNHTRWYGQELIYELSCYLVSLLEEVGHQAMIPELADFYKLTELPDGGRLTGRIGILPTLLAWGHLASAMVLSRRGELLCAAVVWLLT